MTEHGTESSRSIKKTATQIIVFFQNYFKNPVQGMKQIPNWDWTSLSVTIAAYSLVTAILAGLISRSTTTLLGNVVTHPLFNFFTLFLVTTILFYLLQYLYQHTCDYKKLFTVVFLASLPGMLLRVLSPFDIPVSIVGVLAACFLISVGLIENFFLPKKGILKVMGGFFGVFFVFWMISVISISQETEATKVKVTKESLDILQKELTGQSDPGQPDTEQSDK